MEFSKVYSNFKILLSEVNFCCKQKKIERTMLVTKVKVITARILTKEYITGKDGTALVRDA